MSGCHGTDTTDISSPSWFMASLGEETCQGTIHTRTPHFFSSPFKARVWWRNSAGLFWCLFPFPVYLYFQFWSCCLPLCYLAGTIAPMFRSSKYNRSHERAERACEAIQSIISILQVRRERDRWRKALCFQPNVLPYPSPFYEQVGVLWRQSSGPGGREPCL